MELTSAVWGDVPMLVPRGALHHDTCDPLEAALDRLAQARHNIVFLDLTEVPSMDEAALAVLVAWVRALGGKGWLGIIGAKGEVRGLLQDGGLIGHPNVRDFADRHAALIVTGERQST